MSSLSEIGPITQGAVVLGCREESAGTERTLFGSFTSTYFPSGCFMHRSIIAFTMPHPLASETFNWLAKSNGRYDAVVKITWRVLSRGLAREM